MNTLSTKSTPAQRQVPAVSRAIAILEFLASAKEPIGVVLLARAIDLIPSTCLHILRVLADDGLVMVDPQTKQYSIGGGVLSLARAYARRDPFIQVTRSRLEDLSRDHGCAFAAVERNGPNHCIVVAIGDTQAGLSVRVSIGTKFPGLVSSTGMCFAAFGQMTSEEIRLGFERLEWGEPYSFEEWLEAVEATKRAGYAVDDGHFSVGARIVSVPVFLPSGMMLGCIAAVGLRERLEGAALEALITNMRLVAGEANDALAARSGAAGSEVTVPEKRRRLQRV